MRDKHQTIEEPCEGKLSSTVLKTSGTGDSLAEFNPNNQQSIRMESWLNLLRSSYNWSLTDRINTYEQRLIQGEYCDLRTKAVAYPFTCCVTKGGATGEPWRDNGKRRSAGEIQITALPQLKVARPWFKDIDSTVLQQNIKRLDKAYENFFREGRDRDE